MLLKAGWHRIFRLLRRRLLFTLLFFLVINYFGVRLLTMIFVIIVFSMLKHLSEVLLCLFHCIAVMTEVCRCHMAYVHRIVIVVRLLHGVESGVHLPTR